MTPQPSTTAADSSQPVTRWMAYSAAATAGVGALTSGANADVQHVDIFDAAVPQFGTLELDLDGDSNNDIRFSNYVFGGGNYQGLYVPFFPGKVVGFNAGLNYATALSSGNTIDAAATSGGVFVGSLAYGFNNPNAQFNNAVDAFIGLEFPINGLSHFAWIRVSIDNAAGEFIVHDYAYNDTPGVGIEAGEIPAPGTLGLLAAGSLGLMSHRKRLGA